jgi:hypothetical protein
VAVLRALLGACRLQPNLEIGEWVANWVFEVDLRNAADCVLLSDIYVTAGKWDLSASIWSQAKERYVKKQPGHTWIEVNNEVHILIVD